MYGIVRFTAPSRAQWAVALLAHIVGADAEAPRAGVDRPRGGALLAAGGGARRALAGVAEGQAGLVHARVARRAGVGELARGPCGGRARRDAGDAARHRVAALAGGAPVLGEEVALGGRRIGDADPHAVLRAAIGA